MTRFFLFLLLLRLLFLFMFNWCLLVGPSNPFCLPKWWWRTQSRVCLLTIAAAAAAVVVADLFQGLSQCASNKLELLSSSSSSRSWRSEDDDDNVRHYWRTCLTIPLSPLSISVSISIRHWIANCFSALVRSAARSRVCVCAFVVITMTSDEDQEEAVIDEYNSWTVNEWKTHRGRRRRWSESREQGAICFSHFSFFKKRDEIDDDDDDDDAVSKTLFFFILSPPLLLWM